MNLWDTARHLMSQEMSDKYSLEALEKTGRLNDDELKARRLDNDYHYGIKYKLLWDHATWEEQIQLAVKFYSNVHFERMLDSAQMVAVKLLR